MSKGTELVNDDEERPSVAEFDSPVDNVNLKYFGAEMNIIKSPMFIGDRKMATKIAINQHKDYLESIQNNKEEARSDASYEDKFFNNIKIEVEREDADGNKHELTSEVIVIPDPSLGYPSAFDWIVLRNVEELASRHLATKGYVPEWINFRIKDFTRQVYNKENIGGKEVRNVEASLSRFRRTRIKSKWSWRNKLDDKWISTTDQGITIFNRVHRNEKRVRSRDNRNGDWCIYLDPLYRKSLNDHYYLIYDKKTFHALSAKSDLAKLLYEKFYLHFMNMGPDQKYVLKRYESLCDALFIKKNEYLSKAKEQMGDALDELNEIGLLHWDMYVNEKGEIIIKTFPGSLYRRLQVELKGKSLADLDPKDLTDGVNQEGRQITLYEAGIGDRREINEPKSSFKELLSKISSVTDIDYHKIENIVKPLEEDYQACLMAAQAGIEYINKLHKEGRSYVKVKVLASAFKERWVPSKFEQKREKRGEEIKAVVMSFYERTKGINNYENIKNFELPVLKDYRFNYNNQKLRIIPFPQGNIHFINEKNGKKIEINLNLKSVEDLRKRIVKI